MLKRLVDLLLSAVAILAHAPLMLAIALVLRWTFGSPVIWRQVRPGLRGKPFTILKFRTMSDEHGADGTLLPDEQRLGTLGSFLRRSSLDELPELFNVLKGEMSLVGPRPLLMRYLDRYTAEQQRRHEVRPGMTGWAQIHGRNAITWEQKFALDVWYVDHQNFWLDMKILCLTLWKVPRREGISEPGQATMREFLGTRS
jgi:sugar transferase EpsL